MPELAEVEFFKNVWSKGLPHRITRVELNPGCRVFRKAEVASLRETLTQNVLLRSLAHGKQMAFGFKGRVWLHVHLGMAGRLLNLPLPYLRDKHDHLVLHTARRALVFRDTRHFGNILLSRGEQPLGWEALPPALLDPRFTRDLLVAFLQRRRQAPIKAVLLMQERFPGIGNWMADEILWRARIHPGQKAGTLTARQQGKLFQEIRAVAEDALAVIGTHWGDPPDSWLFNHRWRDGGLCPKSGKPLVRETIGGRTTCFSPALQRIKEVP